MRQNPDPLRAEQPDQGRKNPPRLRAVNGIHFLPHLLGGLLCQDDSAFPIVAMVFQLYVEAFIAPSPFPRHLGLAVNDIVVDLGFKLDQTWFK